MFGVEHFCVPSLVNWHRQAELPRVTLQKKSWGSVYRTQTCPKKVRIPEAAEPGQPRCCSARAWGWLNSKVKHKCRALQCILQQRWISVLCPSWLLRLVWEQWNRGDEGAEGCKNLCFFYQFNWWIQTQEWWWWVRWVISPNFRLWLLAVHQPLQRNL